MKSLLRLFLRFKFLSLLFVGFTVVYIGQALNSVPDARILHKYNVSLDQLHVLTLSVIIPYIIIWFIGLVGYMRLKVYVNALGDSQDGTAFRNVALGILGLVLWLPTSVLLAGVASGYYGHHPDSTATQIRIVNYFNVVVVLAAFYYLYIGSKQLGAVAKVKSHGLTQRQSFYFMIFSVLYTFVALSDSVRQASHDPTVVATYYEPDWLIVLTVLIPRLIGWFIGLAAVANIILYRKKVKGAIYKLALRQLAIGLGIVVFAVVILRVLQSLTSVLGKFNLGLLFLLVYVLLVVIGAGYVYIARGASRLLKIEEL
jgi:hypothetical protein